jgi:hypothetical protein
MSAGEKEALQMMEMGAAVAMAKASLDLSLRGGGDVTTRAEEAAALFDRFLGGDDRVAAAATYNQAVAFAVAAELGQTLKPILIALTRAKLDDFDALAHHLLPVDAPILERAAAIRKALERERRSGQLDL